MCDHIMAYDDTRDTKNYSKISLTKVVFVREIIIVFIIYCTRLA